MYESKIDEFILSHKSLASECKRLEQLREEAEGERERLALALRDLEETQRRPEGGRPGERTGIAKIKEQYAESVRQMRDTVHIEFESLFDSFRVSLGEMDRRVAFQERRVRRAEEELRRLADPLPARKSEIYIEEGSEMASEGSARKNNLRSVVHSRLEEGREDEVVRPLQ